jgi:hypothetical protein
MLLLTIICYQYFVSNQYHFPDPVPFKGDSIYNPYAGLNGRWRKANFHAHSLAWGGITNGRQTPQQIYLHYRDKLNYDIASISNYEKRTMPPFINPSDYIPVYEHGYNIRKVHQLVFGHMPVCLFDISFFQSVHNKQYIINCEKSASTVVAITHPAINNAYTLSDLRKLSGYDLIEVLNRNRIAEPEWDAALSAGKNPWIIANDDCHDISNPDKTGISWTMVNSPSNNTNDILNALERGKTYGVLGTHGRNDHCLEKLDVSGNVITVKMDSIAQSIKFIGQNGKLKKEFRNTDKATFQFSPAEHYLRTVINFSSLTIYLNPVIRYNGKKIPYNSDLATINVSSTFLIRSSIAIAWLLGILLISGRISGAVEFLLDGKKRRRPASTSGEISLN